jgi:tellurite resistance protein TehA-like permease
MVFPLAMYTTATFQLSRALHFPFVARISEGFIWLALAAWVAAFVGLVAQVGRGLFGADEGPWAAAVPGQPR